MGYRLKTVVIDGRLAFYGTPIQVKKEKEALF